MHNYSIQLIVKQLFVCFSVVFDAVNRDVKFARDGGSFTIIKRDDIGVIVMLQMILIDCQEIRIRAKNNRDVADDFLMRLYHISEPGFDQTALRTAIRVVRIVKRDGQYRMRIQGAENTPWNVSSTTRPSSENVHSSDNWRIKKTPRPFGFSRFSGAVGSGTFSKSKPGPWSVILK